MKNEISDYLRMIDDADNAHSPTSRAAYSDALIDVLRDIFTDEEIQALAQAKADGRLVVLPCKVGEMVYFTQNICEYKHCDTHTRVVCCGCPDYAKNKFVIQSRAFTLMDLKDIGKTVFLTREEAEKALGGGEDGK